MASGGVRFAADPRLRASKGLHSCQDSWMNSYRFTKISRHVYAGRRHGEEKEAVLTATQWRDASTPPLAVSISHHEPGLSPSSSPKSRMVELLSSLPLRPELVLSYLQRILAHKMPEIMLQQQSFQLERNVDQKMSGRSLTEKKEVCIEANARCNLKPNLQRTLNSTLKSYSSEKILRARFCEANAS